MTTAEDTNPGVSVTGGDRHPLVPLPYRVTARRIESPGVSTLALEPLGQPVAPFRAGQFNMITAFGIGEAALSVSGVPGQPGRLEHTVRDVGPVSHRLEQAPEGTLVGVRGPFGTSWDVDGLDDLDVVVVAGGIGLAPLRGAVWELLERPSRTGRTTVLLGARSPDQICFSADLDRWRSAGAQVEVTVDAADGSWSGRVGVVTDLLRELPLEPERCVALVCGPEVMMRFVARGLTDRGMAAGRIRISLERNMQCGLGWCGHCQLGPLLVCRDGPVVTYSEAVGRLLQERER